MLHGKPSMLEDCMDVHGTSCGLVVKHLLGRKWHITLNGLSAMWMLLNLRLRHSRAYSTCSLVCTHIGDAQGAIAGHTDSFAIRKASHAQGVGQVRLPLKRLRVQLNEPGQLRRQL